MEQKGGLSVVAAIRCTDASNDVVLNYGAELEKAAEEKQQRK